MSLEVVIIVISLFILLQAFFAGSEIALISCDKIKMRALAEEGSNSAKLVLQAYKNIEDYLTTTLVGINISLIISTLILTFYMENALEKGGEIYTILILSPLIVIFGQVVPKAVFQSKRNSIILWAIYPLWVFSKFFFPVLKLVNIFSKIITRLIGKDRNQSITRKELLDVIEGDTNKPVHNYKKEC